jgi:hypothetical protein
MRFSGINYRMYVESHRYEEEVPPRYVRVALFEPIGARAILEHVETTRLINGRGMTFAEDRRVKAASPRPIDGVDGERRLNEWRVSGVMSTEEDTGDLGAFPLHKGKLLGSIVTRKDTIALNLLARVRGNEFAHRFLLEVDSGTTILDPRLGFREPDVDRFTLPTGRFPAPHVERTSYPEGSYRIGWQVTPAI